MPNTDFSQLTKLPFLVDHYMLHVEEAEMAGESFTVLDFIYVHYISPDDHTHEIPVDHGNLPIKQISSSLNLWIQTIDLLSINKVIGLAQNVFSPKILNGRIISHFIFHPPS